jgi:chorismate mutase
MTETVTVTPTETATATTTVPEAGPATATLTTTTATTTPEPLVGTDRLIAEKRHRIDALDARLIALVGERMAVSGEIQAARIGSGGRRVQLTREMEVLRAYGDALGKPGTALAMTLLELCRGRV